MTVQQTILLLAETLPMRIKPLKYDSDDEFGAASSPVPDKHGSSNDSEIEVEPLDVRNELPFLPAKLR